MNVVVPDRLRESQYGYPNLLFRLGWALHLLSFFAIGTNFDLYFLSIGTCFDLYFRFCTVECRFFLFEFVFHLIGKVLGFFLTIFSLKELKKTLKMMLWPCRSQSDRSWRAWLVWKVISRPSKPQLCFSFFLKHLFCRRSSKYPRRHGIGICCWWPRRGSCRTPRSNETVSGFRLYCMCSCAWHSNILTEHETGNVTLVSEQGKRSATYGSYSWRLDTYGSYSWRSTEFYDQPPSPFLLSFSGSLARQCDVRSGRSWRLPCPFLFFGQIWENFHKWTNDKHILQFDPSGTYGYLNHFTQILGILNTFLPCTCNEI